MIKTALQYIVGLSEAKIFEVNGQKYSDKSLHVLETPTVEDIRVNSLSGLVEYLKSNFDQPGRLMVQVQSPTRVVAFDPVNENKNRNVYVTANAMVPDFHFDRWYDAEGFNIKLQSCFVDTEDKQVMLKVVGNIKEETVQTIGDDGVSQAVTAKIGVATVSNVKVPNPVILRPYRTFVEVEQPASSFVFRMKNGPSCALFEADGGAWKLEAMKNIKDFLEGALRKEVEQGQIVIIA